MEGEELKGLKKKGKKRGFKNVEEEKDETT